MAKKVDAIDLEIQSILDQMGMIEDKCSTQYQRLQKQLDGLVTMRVKLDANKPQRKKVDPNTLISIGAEFGLCGLIMNYERLHVIATKAFSRLPKLRWF